MEKFRKTYHEVRHMLTSPGYHNVIFVLGLRLVGKSYMLQQLSRDTEHEGLYINFRDLLENGVKQVDLLRHYTEIYDASAEWILLDEVGCIPNYQSVLRNINTEMGELGKSVVITGTSYESLRALAYGSLGARSNIVEMFPLCFEEYLYFTNKIERYGEAYTPTVEDVHNYYRMHGLPNNMQFIVNDAYMSGMFRELDMTYTASTSIYSSVELARTHYIAVADVIAYSLNYMNKYGRITGASPINIAAQEYGPKLLRKMDTTMFNASIIAGAEQGIKGLSVIALARVIAYMVSAGFLFGDLTVSELDTLNCDHIVRDLVNVVDAESFKSVLSRYPLSVISPLLYTRLLLDLEKISGVEANNTYGELYELAIKAEDVFRHGFHDVHYSYKYNESLNLSNAKNEVDLYAYEGDCTDNYSHLDRLRERQLLLEVTTGRKVKSLTDGTGRTEHNLKAVYPDRAITRVVTDKEFNERHSCYHVVHYPLALLMLSNGTIFDLEATVVN